MEPNHVSRHRRGTARCPLNAARRHGLRISATRRISPACVNGGWQGSGVPMLVANRTWFGAPAEAAMG
jgi:hypothetical protein